MSWAQLQPFLVALAIGLLLGLERERSRNLELPAGSRSFALLSLAGAVAASVDEWAVVADQPNGADAPTERKES